MSASLPPSPPSSVQWRLLSEEDNTSDKQEDDEHDDDVDDPGLLAPHDARLQADHKLHDVPRQYSLMQVIIIL